MFNDPQGIAFFRLHKLVQYGWLPQLGGDNNVLDAIWLTHPDSGTAILYPNGRFVDLRESFRIESDGSARPTDSGAFGIATLTAWPLY